MRTGEPRARQEGFSYLLLLFAVAAIGLTLAGAGRVWHQAAQRERETELLFIGHQFRQALTSYHDRTPVGTPAFPQTLEELLEDRRFPVPQRHLRTIYRDPMTGATDWVLVREAGRIVGLHSRSQQPALRSSFHGRDAVFRDTVRHDEWVFRIHSKPS